VRWALAYKRLAHQRISYLPGPHLRTIRKMTGQTSTPVLAIDGRLVAGSAAIIDALEQRQPDRPLYPSDARLREQALALQARFDAEVGPATRTVAFTVFVDELGYVTRLFAGGEGAAIRIAYRIALPLVRPLMAKANGVTDAANVRRAFDTTQRTLDWIEQETRSRGLLIGDTFSVADLTAAALMAPVVALDHPDMQLRQPVPDSLKRAAGTMAGSSGGSLGSETVPRPSPRRCRRSACVTPPAPPPCNA
jgi:glutathione S-transferase